MSVAEGNMNKKFGGFNDQQKEVLARKMGFKGPMDQFNNFLQSSPANAQKFQSYESKAQAMVASSKEKRGFSTGGLVGTRDSGGDYSPSNAPTTSPTTPPAAGTTGTNPVTTGPAANTSPIAPTNITSTSTNALGQTSTNNVGFVAPNLNSEFYQTSQDMLANPQNYITPTQTETMGVNQNEMVSTNSGQVGANGNVTAQQTQTATAGNVNATAAPQVTAATSSDQVAAAANNMQAAQGVVGPDGLVVAATAQPSGNATVQGQLAQIMTQFENGNIPAWAAGAVRNVNGIMAQRGLGSSSIAASATTQAAMESSIAIAVQDANTFSQFEMANLNNRQQARLQNAQAFLQMDLANLDNRQQTEIVKTQSIIQGLFTDQAAVNAERQFNASSQAQTDQFFSSLKAQTDQFNVAQKNGMEQFNSDQVNSVATFNRQMNDARDQFNAANRLIVDQSNAQWRRSVTTANNATINEANRLDAQAATGMTQAAYNNLMQVERDFYSFAYTASENSQQRIADMVMAQYQAAAEGRATRSAGLGQALGSLAGAAVNGIFGKLFG